MFTVCNSALHQLCADVIEVFSEKSDDELELYCASRYGKEAHAVAVDMLEEFAEQLFSSESVILEKYNTLYYRCADIDSYKSLDRTILEMNFQAMFVEPDPYFLMQCSKAMTLLTRFAQAPLQLNVVVDFSDSTPYNTSLHLIQKIYITAKAHVELLSTKLKKLLFKKIQRSRFSAQC